MTIEYADKEPEKITQGITAVWERNDLSDFPADTWTATLEAVMSGEHFQVVAAANGLNYRFTIAKTATDDLEVGIYNWQLFVDDGSVRYMVEDYGYRGIGTVEVIPDFATQSSGLDDRSHAKIVLDAIEAVIEGKATKDKLSYTVTVFGETRSMTDMTWTEILEVRRVYKTEYQQELDKEAAERGDPSRNIIKPIFNTR